MSEAVVMLSAEVVAFLEALYKFEGGEIESSDVAKRAVELASSLSLFAGTVPGHELGLVLVVQAELESERREAARLRERVSELAGELDAVARGVRAL